MVYSVHVEAGVKCQLSHSIGGTSRKEPWLDDARHFLVFSWWHELIALAGTHECHGLTGDIYRRVPTYMYNATCNDICILPINIDGYEY